MIFLFNKNFLHDHVHYLQWHSAMQTKFYYNTGGGDTKDDIENTLSLIMALPVVLQKISCLQLLPSLLDTFDK